VVDQLEAEDAFGLERLKVAMEEQQTEVKIDQIWLLCEVLFDVCDSLFEIFDSELNKNYSSLDFMRWQAKTINTGMSFAL
jgi:hypothetical protein